MLNDLEQILITEEQLKDRVAELGKTLAEDYKGKEPLLLCILKGSSVFFADIARAMNIPLEMDFIAVSSYGAQTMSSGKIKMKKDIEQSIYGKDVLIIEDIIDTGYTLTYLKQLLLERNPASLKICTLLNKEARRVAPIKPDYVGFEIDDYFVVGYGLDYNEKYRNLPLIGVLKQEIYSE